MPLVIRVPRNNTVLLKRGPYRGALNVLDRKQTAVQRQLARGGLASYEPMTQATLLALVELSRQPAVFFDVGAHIGLYSALVDTIFPDGSVDVRAFEPTPETAAVARQLMLTNSRTVRVEELAMSSSPGTARLFISEKAETSNSMVEGFRSSSETVDVEVSTIDAYCREHGIVPSVVKIDVETLEAQVLLGGLQTFKTSRPSIVCEILVSNDHVQLSKVLGSMRDLGYTLHHVSDRGVWTKTDFGDYQRYLNHEHRDWLLVHGALPRGLQRAIRRWVKAISECTEATNLLLTSGEIPQTWNQPYPRLPSGLKRLPKRIVGRLARAARM